MGSATGSHSQVFCQRGSSAPASSRGATPPRRYASTPRVGMSARGAGHAAAGARSVRMARGPSRTRRRAAASPSAAPGLGTGLPMSGGYLRTVPMRYSLAALVGGGARRCGRPKAAACLGFCRRELGRRKGRGRARGARGGPRVRETLPRGQRHTADAETAGGSRRALAADTAAAPTSGVLAIGARGRRRGRPGQERHDRLPAQLHPELVLRRDLHLGLVFDAQLRSLELLRPLRRRHGASPGAASPGPRAASAAAAAAAAATSRAA